MMFGLRAVQQPPLTVFEVGRLRHKYGRNFDRVVSNRLNDRTLTPVERARWRAVAEYA